eukprot:gb/GECG01003145.1/.p1 GENE.gb/GECG01003145.1/~~gb/GECG01003145.1/.p1  ORF type:complete len:103 (+),score=4.38 gb/GECG01003145.1/:1-309(+)
MDKQQVTVPYKSTADDDKDGHYHSESGVLYSCDGKYRVQVEAAAARLNPRATCLPSSYGMNVDLLIKKLLYKRGYIFLIHDLGCSSRRMRTFYISICMSNRP